MSTSILFLFNSPHPKSRAVLFVHAGGLSRQWGCCLLRNSFISSLSCGGGKRSPGNAFGGRCPPKEKGPAFQPKQLLDAWELTPERAPWRRLPKEERDLCREGEQGVGGKRKSLQKRPSERKLIIRLWTAALIVCWGGAGFSSDTARKFHEAHLCNQRHQWWRQRQEDWEPSL